MKPHETLEKFLQEEEIKIQKADLLSSELENIPDVDLAKVNIKVKRLK